MGFGRVSIVRKVSQDGMLLVNEGLPRCNTASTTTLKYVGGFLRFGVVTLK